MRYSKLFPKTLKQPPSNETSANAKLLQQAGFIRKHMAGVYNFLPLGLRVLNKISQVIREEMDAIGGQEILMSAMQPKELWERTGRWDSLGKDVMYQFKDSSGKDVGLGITHEEVITEIASKMISSYKDLPLYVYQIQTKFRDEPRARFGLVRGKEFLMKDLYSFDLTKEKHQQFYKKCWEAYIKAFSKVGLKAKVVEASGGVFSKEYSHEFQVLIDSGEDEVVFCKNCGFAQNREICKLQKRDKCPDCAKEINVSNAIEVGNIFHLGTRFSDALGLTFNDNNGNKRQVIMGSYGWGPSRVMGTIVEVHHDQKGIIWPESVSPYDAHLVHIEDPGTEPQAKKTYDELTKAGVDVLWDDREDVSAGEKFADCDLIGIPIRLVVSRKVGEGNVEWKRRDSDKTEIISVEEVLKRIKK